MKKNMAYILVANVLYLFIGLVSSFVLPKFLSVDSYSYFKTFTLYVGYAGVIQLGYADGMYLYYGGKELDGINDKTIAVDINNYIILNLIVGFCIFIVSAIMHSTIGVIVSIAMICDNFLGFFRSLFQAIGEFKNYGLALNIQKFSILIIQLLIMFVFHSDNYLHYSAVSVFVTFGCAVYFYLQLSKKKTIRPGMLSFQRAMEMIKQGIVLLIGNFANLLFTSLDRWFIKALMANLQFAQYSFAVSAESLINALISPITVSFYNAFCKNSSAEYIKKSKRISMIFGVLAISTVFPIVWVTKIFLPKYTDSVTPLVFLFGAHSFYAVVKGVYVNLYKVNKKQNKYLFQLIELIIIATLLNTILYFFYRKMDAFAIATFLTALLWLIICEVQNPNYRFAKKECAYFLIVICVYFALNFFINEVLGFIIYITTVILGLRMLLPEVFEEILGLFKEAYLKIAKRKLSK
ncbi:MULTISPECIES: hypothetical protein [unclassified Butyrivibrio]|uniref:hypothetical protein n=1 Tax=unclassified Butyrivibrio TaxID=2639466 RepID=UPI0003F90E1C|nr:MULTISPECIES: hypothetical protein [unclassified Butyrivibrio]